MGNFLAKLDLLKFKNACVTEIKGKTSTKKGIFIPIEDNEIFLTTGMSGKPKSAYFDLVIFEGREPSKFGETHVMKRSLSKEARSKMSDEEKRAMPIFGNMKPMEFNNATHVVEAPVAQSTKKEDDDSLPF